MNAKLISSMLTNWLTRSNRRASTFKRRSQQNQQCVAAEVLEIRQVPAATAILQTGVLTITGTDQADNIVVTQSGKNLQISGVGTTFAASSVKSVVVNAGAGDDTVDLTALKVKAQVNGGAGNDLLIGGSGNDTLSGEAGNDTLTGNAGNDSLDGGADLDQVQESANANFVLTNSRLTGRGTDTLVGVETASLHGGSNNNRLDASKFTGSVSLFGGDGKDTLIGGSGDDQLFGELGNDNVDGGAGIDTVDSVGNDMTKNTERFVNQILPSEDVSVPDRFFWVNTPSPSPTPTPTSFSTSDSYGYSNASWFTNPSSVPSETTLLTQPTTPLIQSGPPNQIGPQVGDVAVPVDGLTTPTFGGTFVQPVSNGLPQTTPPAVNIAITLVATTPSGNTDGPVVQPSSNGSQPASTNGTNNSVGVPSSGVAGRGFTGDTSVNPHEYAIFTEVFNTTDNRISIKAWAPDVDKAIGIVNYLNGLRGDGIHNFEFQYQKTDILMSQGRVVVDDTLSSTPPTPVSSYVPITVPTTSQTPSLSPAPSPLGLAMQPSIPVAGGFYCYLNWTYANTALRNPEAAKANNGLDGQRQYHGASLDILGNNEQIVGVTSETTRVQWGRELYSLYLKMGFNSDQSTQLVNLGYRQYTNLSGVIFRSQDGFLIRR